MEAIEKFKKEAVENDELRQELIDTGADIAAIVKIAKSRGYIFSEDDLKNYSATSSNNEQLSDEQLNEASGAGVPVVIVVIGAVGGGSAGPNNGIAVVVY